MTLPEGTRRVNTLRPRRFANIDALHELHQTYGATLIPIEVDPVTGKKPPVRGFRKDWQKRKHEWPVLLPHAKRAGIFGLIPNSLGFSVLDWDSADWDSVARFSLEYPTPLMLPSLRDGRFHFYYDDPEARRNGTFHYGGQERGESISSGYVGMYHNAPQRIVGFLESAAAGEQLTFPQHLLGPESPPTEDTAVKGDAQPRRQPEQLKMPNDLDDWAGVTSGKRNPTLFDQLRFYARRVNPSDYGSLEAWNEHLLLTARVWENHITDRRNWNGATETKSVARSVAEYSWNRRGRTDPKTQAYRGRLSGVARREKTRERDDSIVEARRGSLTFAEIAARFDISERTAKRVYARRRKLTLRADLAPPIYVSLPPTGRGLTRGAI